MSKKENTSIKEIKAPKSVEIKLLVPWQLIIIMAFTALGFAIGFHYNQQIEQTIDARSAQLAEKSKDNQ